MGDASKSAVDMRTRTKSFALRIVRLYVALPKSSVAQVLGKQVLRSGTSVGAHYHEAYRAKSDADLVTKLEGALQELEETCYWLDLFTEAGILKPARVGLLRKEAEESKAILITSVLKTKSRSRKS